MWMQGGRFAHHTKETELFHCRNTCLELGCSDVGIRTQSMPLLIRDAQQGVKLKMLFHSGNSVSILKTNGQKEVLIDLQEEKEINWLKQKDHLDHCRCNLHSFPVNCGYRYIYTPKWSQQNPWCSRNCTRYLSLHLWLCIWNRYWQSESSEFCPGRKTLHWVHNQVCLQIVSWMMIFLSEPDKSLRLVSHTFCRKQSRQPARGQEAWKNKWDWWGFFSKPFTSNHFS